MDFHLGALAPRHRDRIHEILDATAAFRPAEVDIALQLFDDRDVDDYEFIGAFADDDALCGYACYGPTPATDRTYDLYWIAVHPDFQGTGGGSRLLAGVEDTLRKRGGRLLVVETSAREDYAPTRHFYESRGYAQSARIRDFYAPADDRVIYTKRLAPPTKTVRRRPR